MQIEEVDNREIEYEEHGDVDNEINLVGNTESSAEEAKAKVLPQAPPVQQPPPPGAPQAQLRAAPRARAPPGPTNNWDILDAIIELGRTARQHCQDGQAAQIREPDTFDGTDPKKLKGFIFLCNMNFCMRLLGSRQQDPHLLSHLD